MREFCKRLGLWLWKALKFVGQAIAIVLALPFLLIGILIPQSWWKSILRIAALLLLYRYLWPRRNPFIDMTPFIVKVPFYATHIGDAFVVAGYWVHDQTNVAVLALIVSTATFIATQISTSQKDKKALREKFDMRRPEVTVRFALTEKDGWVCTILNLGSGMALTVSFRFYVYDLPPDTLTEDGEFTTDGKRVQHIAVDKGHKFYLHKRSLRLAP